MILDRFYAPADGELIYHYCPPAAFLEIMRSQTVWLSAYWALNNSTERRWGYSIFEKAIEGLRVEVEKSFIDEVSGAINAAHLYTVVMVSSYSLDADVLSQWRAYADDGRGFAVGFSAKQMEQMPAKALRAIYDEDRQLYELTGNLKHIYGYERSIGFRFDGQFRSHLFQIGLDLNAYKNPAFREEREIRLAHMSGLVPEGKSLKIRSLGARDHRGKIISKPSKVHFGNSRGVVVPYVILDYSNRGAISPVKEVILGPQNENANSNIEIFLNSIGVKDVAVRRSKVPYR